MVGMLAWWTQGCDAFASDDDAEPGAAGGVADAEDGAAGSGSGAAGTSAGSRGEPTPTGGSASGEASEQATARPPGTCVPREETCDGTDDDCDDRIDEDTQVACEEMIRNADTSCLPVEDGARCLLIRCLPGFRNCDGDPTNGCENAFCE